VTLGPQLIAAPPIDLWPRVVRRVPVPADTEAQLVSELEEERVCDRKTHDID
jgi:hypothetical protein